MTSINKRILSLFGFLLFLGVLQAQDKKIDSLTIALENHKTNDTTRVNLLYSLAFSNFQRDLELTKLYLGEAEDLSNTLNYIKGKAKVNYLKGILESRKSNYDTSLDFFNISLKYYESIEDQGGVAAVYTAFGITHFVQSEYDEALKDYKKATEIEKKLGNKIELINNLIRVANVYSETGRYQEAISNYTKALQQYKLINDEEGISYVHGNIGVIYKSQGNYPLAIEHYNKSLNYSKKISDTLGVSIKLNNLGDAYKSIGKYDKALEYHKQSLDLSIQKESKEQIAINNGNIGNIYIHKKEYEKALRYYITSLKTSQEINNVKQTSICFYNIGEINLLLGKPLIARENFVKAQDICLEINYKQVLSNCYLGIAETYLHTKQYQKALLLINKGQLIAEELGLLENQKKASELLYEIYQNIGQYKKAFESHQQFKILNDSLFNKESVEKITQIEYEHKHKQALDSVSIRELKLTKTMQTTSQDLEKSQRNYLWAIIGVLLLSILLGVIVFNQKLKNAKSKTQNALMEQKLLRSQMTPHFIFNSLSVLQGMILNKEEKKSVHYLSKFSKLLRITLENSRDKTVSLSQELTAVQDYLTLHNLESEAYKCTILVADSIDVSEFEIPPMLIQPFVENAIEHAFVNQTEDKKIDIRLTYEDKKLICTIADNGVGINSKRENNNKNKNSLATTITSERLKALSKDFNMQGFVTIEDRQKYNEQGTLVTLVIPHKKIAV